MMVDFGANLGLPHTRAMGGGLFELRLSGSEGIARVFFCVRSGKRIVLLHGFIKKTQATPQTELDKAKKLLAEAKLKMKHEDIKRLLLSRPGVKAEYDRLARNSNCCGKCCAHDRKRD